MNFIFVLFPRTQEEFMNGFKLYTKSELKCDNKTLIFILIGSFMTLRWARKQITVIKSLMAAGNKKPYMLLSLQVSYHQALKS